MLQKIPTDGPMSLRAEAGAIFICYDIVPVSNEVIEVWASRRQWVLGGGDLGGYECSVFLGHHYGHDPSGLRYIGGVIATVQEIRGVVVDLDEDVGAGEFEGDEVVFLVRVVGVVKVSECHG